jgi:hypothetical protein
MVRQKKPVDPANLAQLHRSEVSWRIIRRWGSLGARSRISLCRGGEVVQLYLFEILKVAYA